MHRFLPLIVASLFLSCSEEKKSSEENSSEVQLQNQKTTYSDSGQSSIELLEYGHRKVEVSYDFVSPKRNGKDREYLAKITTSSFFQSGAMKADRKIKVEMTPTENPSKPEILIEKKCDVLNLTDEYYEVVVKGCCGAENEIEYYDYDNQLIIQGTTTIINCEIPNSNLKFYAAAGHGIQLSYSSSDKYVIDLKFPPDLKDYCGPSPPEIYFRSPNVKDEYSNGVYEFWSLNDVEDKEQINGISLIVAIPCIENLDTLAIPIINGKPFGKDKRHQTVSMKLKNN